MEPGLSRPIQIKIGSNLIRMSFKAARMNLNESDGSNWNRTK